MQYIITSVGVRFDSGEDEWWEGLVVQIYVRTRLDACVSEKPKTFFLILRIHFSNITEI